MRPRYVTACRPHADGNWGELAAADPRVMPALHPAAGAPLLALLVWFGAVDRLVF
jgi:hypothetical protein